MAGGHTHAVERLGQPHYNLMNQREVDKLDKWLEPYFGNGVHA